MPERFISNFEGRCANIIRDFDWSSTPLGAATSWHPEVRSWVGFIVESRFPAAIVFRNGLVTIYNDAFAPILGNKPEAMGRSFADIWNEVWDQIGPIAECAFAGEATYIENYELTIQRFGHPEQAWFTFCYAPLRLSDGSIVGMMDTVVETTSTVQARSQLNLVNLELSHRLKNSMTVATAIAHQSLRSIKHDEHVRAFLERLSSIGQAQRTLLDPEIADQTLMSVAITVLRPLDGLQQITIEGPDIQIGPHTRVSLGMILYELATNAAKYGALSQPEGRVSLSWRIVDANVTLTWRESGGPVISEPSRIGLGTRLIDGGLGAASTTRRWYPAEGCLVSITTALYELRR